MKRSLHLSCAVAFCSVISAVAVRAAVVENFEGTLTQPRLGDAALVDSTFDAPPQGAQQLLLTTLATGPDSGNYSGTDAATVSAAETFLGLQAGSIPSNGATGDVSAIKFTLTLAVGDIVSFQYKFLTSASLTDGQDFAFYTLQLGSAAPTVVLFATVADATNTSKTPLFDSETSTQTLALQPVTSAGTYTFGLAVSDRTNDVVQSGLLVDQVQVVPEPSTCAFLLLAAGVSAAARARLRRNNQRRGPLISGPRSPAFEPSRDLHAT